MAGWCEPVASGIRVTVQVTPNARKTEVVGVLGDTLKIRLQAQPIEGRANDALLAYLSAMLGVPKTALTLLHGHTGRRKMVRITAAHLSAVEIEKILLGAGSKS